jgi:hypothetical protein
MNLGKLLLGEVYDDITGGEERQELLSELKRLEGELENWQKAGNTTQITRVSGNINLIKQKLGMED